MDDDFIKLLKFQVAVSYGLQEIPEILMMLVLSPDFWQRG